MRKIYMSGFTKTEQESNFWQNFHASLPVTASREAVAVLEKAGGVSVKEGWSR